MASLAYLVIILKLFMQSALGAIYQWYNKDSLRMIFCVLVAIIKLVTIEMRTKSLHWKLFLSEFWKPLYSSSANFQRFFQIYYIWFDPNYFVTVYLNFDIFYFFSILPNSTIFFLLSFDCFDLNQSMKIYKLKVNDLQLKHFINLKISFMYELFSKSSWTFLLKLMVCINIKW